MKKLLSILLLFVSVQGFSQTVEKRAGFYDNGNNGKIYYDTVYSLPHVPLFYFNGYGNFVSISDTVRSLFSTAKSPLSYSNGVFDFDTTTHHSYAFYQTVFGSGDGGGSLWTANGSKIYYNAGNVGIGTDTASAPLEVRLNNTGSSIINGLVLSNATPATSTTIQLAPALSFESQFYSGSVSNKVTWQVQPAVTPLRSLSFLINGVEKLNLSELGSLATKSISNAGSLAQSGFLNATGGFASKTSVFSPTATTPTEPRANTEIQPDITKQQTLIGPRFSTVDKLTITSGVISGTIVGGSGYTDGTYNSQSLTGGSGTGFKAHVIVSGGSVTNVIITVLGKNYKVGDVLTGLTGGSGFTYTVTTLSGAPGLEGYDTTTNTKDYYNGESWAKVVMNTYKKVTTNYTATNKDNIISVDNGSSDITITLPDATTVPLHIFTIKRYDDSSTGIITIATSGGNVQSLSDLTFGSTTTLAEIGSYGQSQQFISNGTDYEVK